MNKNKSSETIWNAIIDDRNDNKKFKIPKKMIINEMVFSGILYGIFIAIRFAFKEVNIINGFSPQIHLIVLVLGLFCLQTYTFRILFVFLSPFFLIIFGISGNIFFDYILPCWGFAPFIFFYSIFDKLHQKKNKVSFFLIILIILLMHLVSYFILISSYTISGIIFYQASFEASLFLNAPIGLITMGISLAIVFLSIFPLYFVKGKTIKSIYY